MLYSTVNIIVYSVMSRECNIPPEGNVNRWIHSLINNDFVQTQNCRTRSVFLNRYFLVTCLGSICTKIVNIKCKCKVSIYMMKQSCIEIYVLSGAMTFIPISISSATIWLHKFLCFSVASLDLHVISPHHVWPNLILNFLMKLFFEEIKQSMFIFVMTPVVSMNFPRRKHSSTS